MSEKKQQEFVVSDRRRFAAEGEPRSDSPAIEEEARSTASAVAPPAVESKAEQPLDQAPKDEIAEELPPPPTAHEQQQQSDAYKASGLKMDELLAQAAGGKDRLPVEMNFERLLESFYMTALIQLGAIRQEGEAPSVDVMGARQTIDSINVIHEKTKGNLTEREQHLMQNILFELRMAWIEVTNAIAKNATTRPGPGGVITGIKK